MGKRSNLKICIRLLKLVKPLVGYMVLAIFMGIAGFFCATFLMVFGGYALLDVMGIAVPVGMKTAFICLGAFALFRGILRYGEQSCNHYIAFKLLALIRDKAFIALRKLAPAKLEGREKGNLISVITSDIELLEVFYAHAISPIVIAVGMSVIMCLFLGQYHISFAIIGAVSYLVIGVLIPLIISNKSKDTGMISRTKAGELSSYVLDSMRGLKENIQYQMGDKRLEEINKRTRELSVEEEKMKKISGENVAITNTMILLTDAVMLFMAAYLFINGKVGFDGVLIPVLALMSSFGPVVALANLGSTLQHTFAAGNRVLDILDEQPEMEDVEGKRVVAFSGAKAKNVTFSYGEESILSDLSVDIPKGKVIGITGRSGSGKSTLLKLLMRFWDVQQGSVKISGRDVSDINTENLRAMESFVTQETHLFHDSIEANLRIARLDATREEIVEACKKASIHEFIMKLPKGYETQIGELGDTLSGGEKQRVGLARAFLHNAPFILLDEPTSNLDSLNEAVILRALKEEKEDRTVVLVSHRKSTMRIADAMYSVEHGRTC